MKRRAAILLVASFSFTGNAFGQSPIAVKYCRDLSAAYRQAITRRDRRTPMSVGRR